jgi:hypothetical protein
MCRVEAWYSLRLCLPVISPHPSWTGQVILLENLRFHVEEEGVGVSPDGKKVMPRQRSRSNRWLIATAGESGRGGRQGIPRISLPSRRRIRQ